MNKSFFMFEHRRRERHAHGEPSGEKAENGADGFFGRHGGDDHVPRGAGNG